MPLQPDQEILFTRQRHEADRMGLHWDYRLVAGDKAYSWATKKELPEPGRSIILFEQPVHDRHYALSKKVVIPKGSYGAGVTTLDWVRKARIGENSTSDQLTIHTKDGQKFLLKKLKGSEWGDKAWLFRNLGKTGNKYLEKAASILRSEVISSNEMNVDNKYLEKIALTRLVKEIAKGTVTKPLSNLANAGLIRKPGVYAAGMAKGNAAIAKRIGAKIRAPRTEAEKRFASSGGGYVAVPNRSGGGLILTEKGSGALPPPLKAAPSRNMHEALTRHELFELQDARSGLTNASRHLSENVKKGIPDALSKHLGGKTEDYEKIFHNSAPAKFDQFLRGREAVGYHYSPRVLTRESEMIRKNPYISKLREHRELSGEAATVTRLTRKQFGREAIPSKGHRKAYTAKSWTNNQDPENIHQAWAAPVHLGSFLKKYPHYNSLFDIKRLPG